MAFYSKFTNQYYYPGICRMNLFNLGYSMSFYVYILKSESTGRFYCGYSSDPARRLAQHNDPEYQLSKTTKRFKGPWKIVHLVECDDRAEAMKLEKKIKKRGVALFLDSVAQQME